MEKEKINLMPWAGTFLAILLYVVSLKFRGMLTSGEYEFALMLKGIFPGLSGAFLPKLPAAAATLLTGGLLWLTAAKLKLLHPGSTAGFYLCFPPVWWIGTSASAAPLLALSITLAVSGLFITRRSTNKAEKIASFITGVAGAIIAALIARSRFFTWAGVVMAFLPVIFLTFGVYLEKLDMRQVALRRLNRMAIMTAMLFALLLIYFLLPSFAKICNVELPADLSTLSRGLQLYRPAVALLIPFLWLYIALKAEKFSEKSFFICFAAGFVMLTLPPSVPWNRLSTIPAKDELEQMVPEINQPDTAIFADDSTLAALTYTLDIPVSKVGRNPDDLPPDQLAGKIRNALLNGDVIVVSAKGELDSFLPEDLIPVRYTSRQNCKIFRFTGE